MSWVVTWSLLYFWYPLVPPLKVDISKMETRFVAGESSEIRCQTFGSRPAASISWCKDDVCLSDSSYKVSASLHPVLSHGRGAAKHILCAPAIPVSMQNGLYRPWVPPFFPLSATPYRGAILIRLVAPTFSKKCDFARWEMLQIRLSN